MSRSTPRVAMAGTFSIPSFFSPSACANSAPLKQLK